MTEFYDYARGLVQKSNLNDHQKWRAGMILEWAGHVLPSQQRLFPEISVNLLTDPKIGNRMEDAKKQLTAGSREQALATLAKVATALVEGPPYNNRPLDLGKISVFQYALGDEERARATMKLVIQTFSTCSFSGPI